MGVPWEGQERQISRVLIEVKKGESLEEVRLVMLDQGEKSEILSFVIVAGTISSLGTVYEMTRSTYQNQENRDLLYINLQGMKIEKTEKFYIGIISSNCLSSRNDTRLLDAFLSDVPARCLQPLPPRRVAREFGKESEGKKWHEVDVK